MPQGPGTYGSKRGRPPKKTSAYKMKYKHSAFPFKGSPTKHTVEEEIPQTTAVGVDLPPWMMLPQSGPPSGSSRQRGRKTKKHRYY